MFNNDLFYRPLNILGGYKSFFLTVQLLWLFYHDSCVAIVMSAILPCQLLQQMCITHVVHTPVNGQLCYKCMGHDSCHGKRDMIVVMVKGT